MSYDLNKGTPYMFGTFDFGAGADEVFAVKGPKGKAGRLIDYGVQGTTEVFNGSSTTPKIAIGKSGDADYFGEEFDLNGLATDSAKTVRSSYDEIANAASFDALMVNPDIPADTTVFVTCTGAAGSPTGMGVPYVLIRWDD